MRFTSLLASELRVQSKFAPGDVVRIARSGAHLGNTAQWPYTWLGSMERRVNDGLTYTVSEYDPVNDSVYFEEISCIWPTYCLEHA